MNVAAGSGKSYGPTGSGGIAGDAAKAEIKKRIIIDACCRMQIQIHQLDSSYRSVLNCKTMSAEGTTAELAAAVESSGSSSGGGAAGAAAGASAPTAEGGDGGGAADTHCHGAHHGAHGHGHGGAAEEDEVNVNKYCTSGH